MVFNENILIAPKLQGYGPNFPKTMKKPFDGKNFQFQEHTEHIFQFLGHVLHSEKERLCKFGII